MTSNDQKLKTEVYTVRCEKVFSAISVTPLLKSILEKPPSPRSFHPISRELPCSLYRCLKRPFFLYLEHAVNFNTSPLSEAAESTKCDDKRNQHLFVSALATLATAISIQPTHKTGSLGKWLIITHKNSYDQTVHFIDNHLPTACKERIQPQLILCRFPHPHCASKTTASTTLGRYADRQQSYVSVAAPDLFDNISRPKTRKYSLTI